LDFVQLSEAAVFVARASKPGKDSARKSWYLPLPAQVRGTSKIC
jgi:hypothetical protein